MSNKLNLIIGEQELDFTGMAFPSIKSPVFPAASVWNQSLVNTQPMVAPSTLIFYMDYKFMDTFEDKLIIGS